MLSVFGFHSFLKTHPLCSQSPKPYRNTPLLVLLFYKIKFLRPGLILITPSLYVPVHKLFRLKRQRQPSSVERNNPVLPLNGSRSNNHWTNTNSTWRCTNQTVNCPKVVIAIVRRAHADSRVSRARGKNFRWSMAALVRPKRELTRFTFKSRLLPGKWRLLFGVNRVELEVVRLLLRCFDGRF